MPNDAQPRFFIRDKQGEIWSEVQPRDISFLEGYMKFSITPNGENTQRVYGWINLGPK